MRTMLKVGNRSRSMLIATVALAVMMTGLPEARAAENIEAAKTVINDALSTFNNFMQDPDSAGFRENLKEAKGLLIVPSLMKGAFLFGVEGGNGVLLVRDEKTGSWSEPAFHEVSSLSFGLQAGVQQAESILVVQTVKGIESLLSSTVKLGVGASAAMGSRGGGIEGGSSANMGQDFVTYSRAKGAFAGLSLEGASIRTRDDLNKAYYGSEVRPTDIVLVRNVTPNPDSKPLHEAVVKATAGKK